MNMLERMLSCVVVVSAALVAGAPVGAQRSGGDESSAQIEAAARREAAAQGEAAARREAAAQQEEAVYREAVAQREAVQRAQRQLADVQREAAARHERALEEAREQLAASAAEIARLSAQMREPATNEILNLMRLRSGSSVLGVNVEDTALGPRVIGVSPGGPAATARVAIGDTIVAINDVELGRSGGDGERPTATLLGQMAGVAPGEEVKLRLLRDGDYRDVVVLAGQNMRLPYVVNSGDRGVIYDGGRGGTRVTLAPWGGLIIGPWSDVELVSLTPTLGEYFGIAEGLLVVRAGRASELGLRDGDVILDIGGREPQSPEHALRILQTFEAGESLQAAIMRQRRRETLAITVPSASD